MAVFFVVLHDNCEGEASALDPTPILRRVQAAHPPQQCKLVRLNSLPASAPDTAQPDIWAPTLAPLFFPEAARKDETDAAAAVRGCCLSGDDLLALREFVLDIVGKGVVWTMERRLCVVARGFLFFSVFSVLFCCVSRPLTPPPSFPATCSTTPSPKSAKA